MNTHRFGFISVVGRPNVGKSTLVNTLVGRKISITSRRPQTTRHRILGILTRPDAQYVFVDTPGIHSRQGKALNKIINQTARRSISDVDVIVLMITADGWRTEDTLVLRAIKQSNVPVVLAINKIDRLKDKSKLLPLIQQASGLADFADIVPISAKTGSDLDRLLEVLRKHLPEGSPGFLEGEYTDRGDRFSVGELVREQLFRLLGDELPYATAVEIVEFSRRKGDARIVANILVDRDSQKGIVIGRAGEKLKTIGTRARKEIEQYLGVKVYLDLRVKTRSGWADSVSVLRTLGYSDDT